MNDEQDYTADFKEAVQKAAAQVAFWREHIPGGLRKRHRYRTPGHGRRKEVRRRRNKEARRARRANRRPKKRRTR